MNSKRVHIEVTIKFSGTIPENIWRAVQAKLDVLAVREGKQSTAHGDENEILFICPTQGYIAASELELQVLDEQIEGLAIFYQVYMHLSVKVANAPALIDNTYDFLPTPVGERKNFYDVKELKGVTIVVPYQTLHRMINDVVDDNTKHLLRGWSFLDWHGEVHNDTSYIYEGVNMMEPELIQGYENGTDEIEDGVWDILAYLKTKGIIDADNVIIEVCW